jgi:hypothetical protein
MAAFKPLPAPHLLPLHHVAAHTQTITRKPRALPRLTVSPRHPPTVLRFSLHPSLQVLVWGQDLPGGSYAAMRAAGELPQPNAAREYWAAARNHRTWLLTAVYGFSYGVELTMNNGEAAFALLFAVFVAVVGGRALHVRCRACSGAQDEGWEGAAPALLRSLLPSTASVFRALPESSFHPSFFLSCSPSSCTVLAQYFYDTFDTSLTAAGALAATFGLSNLAGRPAGGWLSDTAARRWVTTD